MDNNDKIEIVEDKNTYNVFSIFGFIMTIITAMIVVLAPRYFEDYIDLPTVIGIYGAIIISLIFLIIGYVKSPIGSNMKFNRICIVICAFFIIVTNLIMFQPSRCYAATRCDCSAGTTCKCHYFTEDGTISRRIITCDNSNYVPGGSSNEKK